MVSATHPVVKVSSLAPHFGHRFSPPSQSPPCQPPTKTRFFTPTTSRSAEWPKAFAAARTLSFFALDCRQNVHETPHGIYLKEGKALDVRGSN